MKKSISTFVLFLTVFIHGSALAEEKPDDKKITGLWKATAELGYVSTSGNTNTETLNTKASATTDREKWHHKIEFTALKSSDGNTTTADKYTLMGQSDYKLKKPSFLFVLASYEDDAFSGYDYQATESVGYGRRVVEESNLSLDLEIGPGVRQSKLSTGESENETIVRAAAKLDWAISKTSNFNEVLTIEAGEDTTITKSVTSLSSKINGSLSMKITYTYKNTSDVPVGDDTDTETAITLVYNFN